MDAATHEAAGSGPASAKHVDGAKHVVVAKRVDVATRVDAATPEAAVMDAAKVVAKDAAPMRAAVEALAAAAERD